MNNAALARHLESELLPTLHVQAAPAAFQPSHRIIPVPPTAAPRGVLHRLWQRLFGPPAIDPRTATTDFGAFRALYEMGADHLPASGTWPSRRP